jgi:nucleoid-associated protein YgaU
VDKNGQEIGDKIEVQFNPTEYTLTKGAQFAEIAIPGIDAPIQQFINGQAERLTLELFFDSTEEGTGAKAKSVTDKTNQFYRLVKMSGQEHAPPRLRFYWGDSEFPGLVSASSATATTKRAAFDCVCESVQQRFTFFNPDGKPLRARLTVTLREYRTLEKQLEELNLQSADHTKLHVVQQGETLPLIAYKSYGDVNEWRRIAAFNRILNPRNVAPGTVLELPPTGE